ncbi:hypothetical protein ASD99_06685 [Mesorhizobium sp. Root695]|nr:hypothetical protein ASD12_09190 [Mesorhizobium sp. Root102]KRB21904.1 hypothetical protein ASD99_06685 [Mesorhizobium sp. Root695]
MAEGWQRNFHIVTGFHLRQTVSKEIVMSERVSGRLGILESTAIVLAIAVAGLAMTRAGPGPRGCAATVASASRDAAPAKPTPEAASPDADATDMLLHD